MQRYAAERALHRPWQEIMARQTRTSGGDDSAHDLSANDKQELEARLRERARTDAAPAPERNRLLRRVHEIARAKMSPMRGGQGPS
jgi:hypothetical protein